MVNFKLIFILNHLKLWNTFGWLASQSLKKNLEKQIKCSKIPVDYAITQKHKI